MALTVTHGFTSGITDDSTSAAAGDVLPSHWNASHTVTGYIAPSPTQFNVLAYGATGNGTTDDTSAINSAIAAFNSAGNGVLYFPSGTYKVTTALTAIIANGVVRGDGLTNTNITGFGPVTIIAATLINFTSTNTSLFTVNSQSLQFENMTLRNTSAGAVAGSAAITVTSSWVAQKVDYWHLGVFNFYIGIDVQVGYLWRMDSCYFNDALHHAVRINNTVNTDGGDWFVCNCVFDANTVSALAGIKVEGAGGGKITHCKFNGNFGTASWYTDAAIDVATAATGDMIISNCSIESLGGGGRGIRIGNWPMVNISNCQIGTFGMVGVTGIEITSNDTVSITGITLEGTFSTAGILLTSVTNVVVEGIAVKSASTTFGSGEAISSSALTTLGGGSTTSFGGGGGKRTLLVGPHTGGSLNGFVVHANGDTAIGINAPVGNLAELEFGQAGTEHWILYQSGANPPVFSIFNNNEADILTFSPTSGGDITAAARRLKLATSATSYASMNISSGATPSAPSNGDLWFDGTKLNFRVGGITKSVTLTSS